MMQCEPPEERASLATRINPQRRISFPSMPWKWGKRLSMQDIGPGRATTLRTVIPVET